MQYVVMKVHDFSHTASQFCHLPFYHFWLYNVVLCNSASSLNYGINTLICPGFKICLQIGMSELRGKALLKVDGNF